MYGWPVTTRISAAARQTLAAPIAGMIAQKNATCAEEDRMRDARDVVTAEGGGRLDCGRDQRRRDDRADTLLNSASSSRVCPLSQRRYAVEPEHEASP